MTQKRRKTQLGGLPAGCQLLAANNGIPEVFRACSRQLTARFATLRLAPFLAHALVVSRLWTVLALACLSQASVARTAHAAPAEGFRPTDKVDLSYDQVLGFRLTRLYQPAFAELAYNPGEAFDFRYGLDFGAVVPELGLGFSRQGFVATESFFPVPVESRGIRRTMWVSPGLRLEIDNASALTPHFTTAFDVYFVKHVFTVCLAEDVSCPDPGGFDNGFAFRFVAGVDIALSKHFAVDIGARLSLLMTEDATVQTGPYLGVRFHL